MTDAHADPALAAALTAEFPDGKLTVLWAALQSALDAGAGLLEASGIIAPDPLDPSATEYYSKLDNCDAASLELYATSKQPMPDGATDATAVAADPVADKPLPPHLQPKDVAHPGDRLPSTPGLSARLRAKREAEESAADSSAVG